MLVFMMQIDDNRSQIRIIILFHNVVSLSNSWFPGAYINHDIKKLCR